MSENPEKITQDQLMEKISNTMKNVLSEQQLPAMHKEQCDVTAAVMESEKLNTDLKAAYFLLGLKNGYEVPDKWDIDSIDENKLRSKIEDLEK